MAVDSESAKVKRPRDRPDQSAEGQWAIIQPVMSSEAVGGCDRPRSIHGGGELVELFLSTGGSKKEATPGPAALFRG